MTRGQRRAHGIVWTLLAALFALAAAHALGLSRPSWRATEAIRDGSGSAR